MASCPAGCCSNFPHAAASHLPLLLAAPLPLFLILPLSHLLSGWLLRCLSSHHHVPCQRMLSCHRLSFLRSHTSCSAGCPINSPHAVASHLVAPLPGGLGVGGGSLRAAASRSAALAPLVWLVVVLPLLMQLRPLSAPLPIIEPVPLVPPLSRLLSSWLLHHLFSRRRVQGQRLCLSLCRCLSFLSSHASCPAGCCKSVSGGSPRYSEGYP